MLKQEVIVMNVSRYDVKDRETGESNKGTTVRYALTTDLSPIETENVKGFKLAKASLGFNDYNLFPSVPGIYNCDINYNIAADGTVKLAAKNFEFVGLLGDN